MHRDYRYPYSSPLEPAKALVNTSLVLVLLMASVALTSCAEPAMASSWDAGSAAQTWRTPTGPSFTDRTDRTEQSRREAQQDFRHLQRHLDELTRDAARHSES